MNTTNPSLAVRLWPAESNAVVRSLALVLIGVVVLWLSAKIKVPFWPVPMTMQTFAVVALAAAYGSRLGVATVVAYLAAGLVGLPVFTNTPPQVAGPLYFLGPTGGFLIGFVVAAAIVGHAADRGWDRSTPKLLAAMLIGDAAVFALGFVWLAWFAALPSGASGIGAAAAFTGGVVPFVLGDLLKIVVAALAVPAVWRLLSSPSGAP